MRLARFASKRGGWRAAHWPTHARSRRSGAGAAARAGGSRLTLLSCCPE